MAVDEKRIEFYMNLERKINRAKDRLMRQRIIFYSQTMSSYITSDGLKVYSQGFSVEENICRYVDKEATLKHGLEVLEFKYKYFKRFFERLPHNTKIALKEKYQFQKPIEMQMTENKCLDEINEIEEACIHYFGYSLFKGTLDDEEETEIENLDYLQEMIVNDFQSMLEAFEI